MAYDVDKVLGHQRQANNPAAPLGARQAGASAAGHAAGYDMGRLGRWVSEDGYAQNSSHWYTGANRKGVENGWDNGFMSKASKQYQEAQAKMAEDPDAFKNWFKRSDATAVVTWGERRKAEDPDDAPRFGDIWNDGKRVGNVYDDYGKNDANHMLAPFMVETKQQAKIFKSADRDHQLEKEIEKARTEGTKILADGASRLAFDNDVQDRQRKLQDAGLPVGLAGAAGVLTGGMAAAGTAAVAGTTLGPLGTIAGGVLGFAGGATAAWMNRDELTELTARTQVQADMAQEKFGGYGKATSLLEGYGGVGMRLISPLSNAAQGAADASIGEQGDGVEDFHAYDSDGNRKAPKWAQVLDVAGVVGDSLLQFSNPVGLGLYTAGMSGTIVGKTGQLAGTGETFDSRTGLYQDHEGFKENAAAAMSVGIDAVQLGMARGLAAAAKSERTLAPTQGDDVIAAGDNAAGRMLNKGRDALYRAGAPVRGAQEKLPYWAGGVRHSEGQRALQLSGSRYVVGADGVAVYKGLSLSALAPSEGLVGRLAVKLKVKDQAVKSNAAMRGETWTETKKMLGREADDYYQAAVALASGKTSRFGLALVNGLGEGVEEAAQAILEPISHDAAIDPMEVGRSFIYGAAAGTGMGLAARMKGAGMTERLYGRVLSKGLFTGEEMSYEDFEQLPQDKQKAMANISREESAKIATARESIRNSMGIRAGDLGPLGQYMLTTAAQSEFERVAAKANPDFNGLLKLLASPQLIRTDADGNLLGHAMPTYGAGMSPARALDEVSKNLQALDVERTSLERDIAKIETRLQAENLPEARRSQDERNLGELQQLLADIETATAPFAVDPEGNELSLSEVAYARLRDIVDRFYAAAGRRRERSEETDAILAEWDEVIDDMYFGSWKPTPDTVLTEDQDLAVRNVVETLLARDPNLEDGSFLMAVPRMDRSLAYFDEHATVYLDQTRLAAPAGDHDGDMLRARRDLMLDRRSGNRIRSGDQYLAMKQRLDEVTGMPVDYVEVIIDAPDAEVSLLPTVNRALNSGSTEMQDTADRLVKELISIFSRRYAPIVEDTARLNEILDSFESDLRAGDVGARKKFLDAMATDFHIEIQRNLSRANGLAEWPWMSQQITAKLDEITQVFANANPAYEYEPGESTAVGENPAAIAMREMNLIEAATFGATMVQIRQGLSDQRGKQGIHFRGMRALVEAQDFSDNLSPDLLAEVGELYESVHSGLHTSALERQGNRDLVMQRVIGALQEMASDATGEQVDFGANNAHALLLLGMTKVQDFDFVAGQPVPKNRDVTLLQFMLRLSVSAERASLGADVLENDPQLASRLDALDAMTYPRNGEGGHSTAAQEAAFEVFADIPYYQLMGTSSQFLGAQRTLRSSRYELLDMDRETRVQHLQGYKRKAPYRLRASRSNPPYTLEESRDRHFHPYYVVVDMLEAVTNKVAPAQERRSEAAMKQFVSGWGNLQKTLVDFRKSMTPDAGASFDRLGKGDQMLAMLNASDKMTRMVGDLIPVAVIHGAFEGDNVNGVRAAQWVHDMFALDPEAAMMKYWLYTTLTEFTVGQHDTLEAMAAEISRAVEQDGEDARAGIQMPRVYAKLQTQSARVFYRLSQDPILFTRFLAEADTASDLRVFMRDVMNTPRFKGNVATIHPFSEDISEVDPRFERTWQPSYPGAIQRDAIAKFAKAAERFSQDVAHAAATQAEDTSVAASIETYLLHLEGKAVKVQTGAAEATAQLALMVENSQAIWPSVGPTARNNALLRAQSGIAQMDKKGAADPELAAFGGSRVLAEGGGASISFMRAIADVTAHTQADVLQNPSLLAHRSMRIQLDTGAEILWVAPETTTRTGHTIDQPRPDLLQYVRLLKDPDTAGFAKEVLGLSVREAATGGNTIAAVFHDPTDPKNYSLQGMLDRASFQHLFPEAGEDAAMEQIEETLSLVEGGVFRRVYGEDAATQRQGYFPLQMMMQELVTAYTQSENSVLDNPKRAQELVDQTKRATYEALRVLADSGEKGRMDAVLLGLKERLTERFGGTPAPEIMNEARTYDQRVQLLNQMAQMRLEHELERQDRIVEQMSRTSDPEEIERLQTAREASAARTAAYMEAHEKGLTDSGTDAVLAMFTVTKDDPEMAERQKKAVLGYLAEGRMGYFVDNETDVWRHVRTELAKDEFALTGEANIPDDMWDTLSRAAATVFLSERSRMTGSTVSLRSIEGSESEWNDLSRYFDHTFFSILDHLRQPAVIDSMTYLMRKAGHTTLFDTQEAIDRIEYVMFGSQKKPTVSRWTSTLVRLNEANRDALLTSGVALAVAIPGNQPSDMATTVASTERDYTMPERQPKTATITPAALHDVDTQMMLEGRFVRRGTPDDSGARLRYRKADGTDGVIDLFSSGLLGEAWGDPEHPLQRTVAESGFETITFARLWRSIEDLLPDESERDGKVPWRVELDMFDPRDRPAGPQWAHNIYYSGAGRERANGTRDNLISELIFSVHGVYQKLTQDPLLAIKQRMMAFAPTSHIDFGSVRQIEQSRNKNIYMQLVRKARLIMSQEYDFGSLQLGDFNSVMELLRLRHAVMGTDAEGNEVTWSVDQAIASQQPDSTVQPLENMRLVALSETLANTLHDDSTGRSALVVAPEIDQNETSAFTVYDNELLADRGVTKLGQRQKGIRGTQMQYRTPVARVSTPRGGLQQRMARYLPRLEVWKGEQTTERDRRSENKFDRAEGFRAAVGLTRNAISEEQMAEMMSAAGFSWYGLSQFTNNATTEKVASDMMNSAQLDGAAAAVLRWDGSSKPSKGIIIPADLDREGSHFNAVYGDHIFMDLASFFQTDMDTAIKNAKAVAEKLARRGVTIHLVNSKGTRQIRQEVRNHLLSDSHGYRRESSSTLVPITDDIIASRTERAMARTMEETRIVNREGAVLEFRSNYFTQANENLTHFSVPKGPTGEPLIEQRIIQRSNIMSQIPFGFGEVPSDRRTEVRDKLLALLSSDEGFEHLVKQYGDKDGVRKSLKQLRDVLSENKWPTDQGVLFGFKHFNIYIGPRDTIYLGRQGYQSLIPTKTDKSTMFDKDARNEHDEIARQARTKVGETKVDPTGDGIGVVIGGQQVDESLNANVGYVKRTEYIEEGGGSRVILDVPVGWLSAKALSEADGFKHGLVEMPEGLSFPSQALRGNQHIFLGSSIKAGRGKEALFGVVNNFRDAILAFGIDFRADMIEFITGSRPTASNFDAEWAVVERRLKMIAQSDLNVSADAVAAALRSDSFYETYGDVLVSRLEEIVGSQDAGETNWVRRTDGSENPTERLGTVLLASLMVDGVQLEHVIGTPGLISDETVDSRARAKYMPPVFTDALDNYRYPELRKMLFDRFNAVLPPARPDGTRDYTLHPNWDFVVRMDLNGEEQWVTGELKITDLRLDDKHPELQRQSEAKATSSTVSLHAAAQAKALFGGRLMHKKDFDRVGKIVDGTSVPQMDPNKPNNLWALMQSVADMDLPESDRNAGQRQWINAATRRHALYHLPLGRDEWEDQLLAADYTRQAGALAKTLFDDESYSEEVDYLVRKFIGARGIDSRNASELTGVDNISVNLALEVLSIMQQNVDKGMSPLHGSRAVHLVDGHFLRTLFEANRGRQSPWIPRAKDANIDSWADMTLGSWVAAFLGQSIESDKYIDSVYRIDNDGAWASYESLIPDLRDIPSSFDNVVNLKLLTPETEELAASLDARQRRGLESLVALEGTDITLESIIMNRAEFSEITSDDVSATAMADRLERTRAWKASSGLNRDTTVRASDYVTEGMWYMKRSTGTNKILHNLTNLRIGLTLVNPALFFASIPEAIIRGSLDNTVSILRGESTSRSAMALNRAGEKMGVTPTFTSEQAREINNLIGQLGNDPRFMSMVYDQLLYQNLIEPGQGYVGRQLERFASLGARMQDAAWGPFAKQVATRYVHNGLSHLLRDPANVITVETFIDEMVKNPMFLAENSPETGLSANKSALNAVANIRSVRQNIVGKGVSSLVEPLATSGRGAGGASIVGHMAKWPLIFTNYTAGAAMFISGTGFIGDWVAAELHGKQKTTKIQQLMRGQENPDGDFYYDMSDILEGIDLTRSFLRSGVTWSGYMLYMLMGGVGLSGEDKEAKRRRLLAKLHGVPLQYDPNAAQNDFRDHQKIWVDQLPGPLNFLAEGLFGDSENPDGRTVMTPHWIVKQFISPVVGIERFMTTGDLEQIKWGFEEAATVLPQSTFRLFEETRGTYRDLKKMVDREADKDDDEAAHTTARLLLSLTSMYQRAFTESSFVNTLRNGADVYDRDPWVKVATDEHKNILFDDDGDPLQTESMQSYIDPDTGEKRQGYDTRSWASAQAHQYAETNATFSGAMALFTGMGDSTYLRRNMAVKEREIPLDPLDIEEAKGLYLTLLDRASADGEGPAFVTEREAASIARNQTFAAQGHWGGTNNAQMQGPAMSIFDELSGREVLTKHGARTIFESVYAGSIDLDSPVLQGIHVPHAMRKEIQKEIVADLINEGLQMGMDELTAKGRASRIWKGNDPEFPSTGLRDLVYSDRVSYNPDAVYKQLNTTYVMGPGGKPFATGTARGGMAGFAEALGVNFIGRGEILNRAGGMDVDAQGNSVDMVLGINTGLAALERKEGKKFEPDDDGLFEQLNQPFKADEFEQSAYRRSGGYGGGRRRRGGGGGGGYSGGGGGGYFTRMNPFPDSRAAYANDIPFINTSNPILRRADIRRERVWSERGRLKQWQ